MLKLVPRTVPPPEETRAQLRAARDAAVREAQVAMRDTTRLMRLLTILGEPADFAVLLDRALITLSELFGADIAVLLDPAGSGSFVPTAAVGLPEDMAGLAFADAGRSPVAQVLRTGLAVVRDGIGNDPDVDAQLRDLGAASVLWVPVNGGHGTRGVLILARCRAAGFAPADVGLVTAMGHRLGIALEQAQRRAQMELMVRAGQQIGCHLDVAAVAAEAVAIFPSVVGADAAVLVLGAAADGGGRVELGRGAPALDGFWQGLADSCRASAQTPGWLLSTPSLAAELGRRGLALPADCPVHSLLAVAVGPAERPLGILFGLRRAATDFPPDTRQIAAVYAGTVASALENARLCQALRDELGERRRLEEELRQAKGRVEGLLDQRTLQLDAAHTELLARKQEYEELYDTAPCGYHSLGADGVFRRVNATEQRMLGYRSEEMVGRMRLHDIVAPHCRHLLDERWRQLLRQGRLADLQLDFLRRDGSVFPGVLNGILIRDEDGEFVATRCVLFDDSERKAGERRIAALNAELERRAMAAEAANGAKSRFLATMSHEVRTPLNAIMGFTELLQQDDMRPAQHKMLDAVAAASQQLLDILDDVLEVARIESADAPVLDEADFDFDDLLRRVVEPAAAKARAKGLVFRQEMGLVPRILRGDAHRLGEILRKLLDNAVKFTAQGSVVLRGRVAAAGADDVVLRFEVADTGIGIAAADGERIFGAFEQADGSSTRSYGGAGLGLAIARRLARLMGGDVDFGSTPGGGSTFRVSLRLALPARPATADLGGEALEAALRREHAGARILVVEDEPINQAVMADMLEDVGLHHDLAADGEQAVVLAGRQAYDLILMDMKMEPLDGLDATRRIRRLPGHGATPIVAVTANAFAGDREQCLQAGMDDYLAKPVTRDQLFAAVYKWLALRSRA
ncbi:MAG: response regulator [Sterolibacteriaceae bacterium MAG5]|nr:response regulator [Candidatus Nitricoxidireducens bremensis]